MYRLRCYQSKSEWNVPRIQLYACGAWRENRQTNSPNPKWRHLLEKLKVACFFDAFINNLVLLSRKWESLRMTKILIGPTETVDFPCLYEE